METTNQEAGPPKSSKVRSPNYPVFPLEEAIGKARVLYEHEKITAVHAAVACEHWGLKATSSTGMRAIATMLAFELVTAEGRGEAKSLKLTEAGRTLVKHPDPDSDEYRAILQKAALAPKIHREIWDKYGKEGLPSEKNLAWALEKEWGFHDPAISQVIAVVKATFSFAKLTPGTKIESEADSINVPPSSNPKGKQENPMPPALALPSQVVRDLPLPLISGGTATLRVPAPLTDEDFDWIKLMLDRLRPSLTAKPPEPVKPAKSEEE